MRGYFLLGLLFMFSFAQAQTNYKKGYYISLEGDTIEGQINYRVAESNSMYCIFREGPGAKPVRLKPQDIQGYVVEDKIFYKPFLLEENGKQYQRFFILLVDAPLALLGLPDQTMGLFPKTDYYLYDNTGGHLFKLKPKREVIYVKGKRYNARDVYTRGMLRANMQSQEATLFKRIEEEKPIYNGDNLTRLVSDYNRLEGNEIALSSKVRTPLHVTLDAFVHTEFQNGDIRFNDVYDFEFESSTVLNFGFSAGIFVPRFSDKVRLVLGSLYSSNDLSSTLVIEDEVNDLDVSFDRLQLIAGLRFMDLTPARISLEANFIHNRFLNSSYNWVRTDVGAEPTIIDVYQSAIGESGNGFMVSLGKDFMLFDDRRLNLSVSYSQVGEELDRANWSSFGVQARFNIIK